MAGRLKIWNDAEAGWKYPTVLPVSTAAEINAGTEAAKAIAPDQLAIALFHVQGDLPYASAADTPARLAKGTANFGLFMNAAGTVPEWAAGIKPITFTRDMTAGTGDVSYTGVGFKPTAILFIGVVDGNNAACWGVYTTGFEKVAADGVSGTAGVKSFFSYSIALDTALGPKRQYAVVKSLDADGFTLTWTNLNGPAGTAYLIAFCLR